MPKLQKNKDSLYGWLNTNVPGWENNIGKVLDEEHVLFLNGYAPQLTDSSENETVYGLSIDLKEINKKVKTVADYEKERAEWQQKADTNKANINKLIEERDSEAGKLKNRYQGRIKDLNNARRQMEYELQRSKGQLQANEVKLADFLRKAVEEKDCFLQQVNQEIKKHRGTDQEERISGIEAGIRNSLITRRKNRIRK
jgi:small-conductance mechanosensitive channel